MCRAEVLTCVHSPVQPSKRFSIEEVRPADHDGDALPPEALECVLEQGIGLRPVGELCLRHGSDTERPVTAERCRDAGELRECLFGE